MGAVALWGLIVLKDIKKALALYTVSTLYPHLVVAINTEQQKEKMCQGVFLLFFQHLNKMETNNISIRTKVGIWMQRQCRQINSGFFFFSPLDASVKTTLRKAFKAAGRKKKKNITVIMPLVNIPHIHPLCFLYGNVPMNLLVCFWMKLSLPLFFFVFFMDAHEI